MRDVLIRPMGAGDLAAAEEISGDAFYELDRGCLARAWPDPERRTPEHSASWIARTARGHLALRGMDPPSPYVHNGALR